MAKTSSFPIFFFLFVLHLHLYSQERQIPVDSANNIKIIDKELEKSLGLFPEYSSFEEAKLFQVTDTTFVLEIYYLKKGDLVKDRQYLTKQQLDEFRNRIQEKTLQKSLKFAINQEGRPLFIGATTALSVYYAIGFGSYINASDKVKAAIVPLTMGAGFFLPFYLTMNIEVTNGMANLAAGTGVLGIGLGYSLNTFADIDLDRSESFIFPTILSISGLLGGASYAKANKISEGKADAIASMSFIGAPYFLGLTYVLFGDKVTSDQLAGGFILGGIGGAFLGNFLSNKIDFAPGDAGVLPDFGIFTTTTILGAAEMGAILLALEIENPRTNVGLLLLGAALGGLRGGYLASKYDFSNAQGNYIALGTFGGTLIGSGICLLLFDKYSNAIPIITMLFGELGFNLTFLALANKQKNENVSGKLDFNLNPFALSNKAREINKTALNQIPFLTISYRW